MSTASSVSGDCLDPPIWQSGRPERTEPLLLPHGGKSGNLDCCQRASQIGHGPSGREQLWLGLVGVVKDERALSEAGYSLCEFVDIDAAARRGECLNDACLVAFRLKPADAPGAGVRHCLVVEIDRVLGGEQQSDAVGAGLLQQRQNRALCRRVRNGWHEAEDLIHVHQHSQIAGALLRPHPRDQLGENERHGELRSSSDRCAR